MSELANEEPRISTLKLSSQGQVTLSKEARQQHGLTTGETLIEISLPGCIILLPKSAVMGDLMLRAQTGLARLGLTAEELKAQVAKRGEEQLNSRYPGGLDKQESSPAQP